MGLTALAPAKVNLFLHVGPLQSDGFHPLASLVAFADVGDQITVAPSDQLSLSVTGPFAQGLDGPDNLILRALRALGETTGRGDPAVAVTLDKQLPVASGIGGGSADAAVALRLTRDLLALPLDDDALAEIASAIGADGAMCVHGKPAWVSGRGERLVFEPRLSPLAALLVNSGVPSLTGPVYGAYDAGPPRDAETPPPPTDWRAPALVSWLARQRNDLQAPAINLEPRIADTLAAVEALEGARLVRMSGSGATVFGLFDDVSAARAAGEVLRAAHPDWWIVPTTLG